MAAKNFSANLKIGAVMGSMRAFSSIGSKIKQHEGTLKTLRAAYKDAEKGTGEYAGKLDQLQKEIDQTEASLKKLRAASKFKIGDSLKGIGKTFGSDAKRLLVGAGMLTAAAAATGAAVLGVTKGFVDWADDIGDTSEALGISTQSLQTWQFAAATVGVGAEKMSASIAKFSKLLMEGGDKTDEAFAKLHINAAKLRKLSLDDQLKVTAEAFSRYKGADKAALAMKMFGKSGYQLTGILSKGAKGFEEFIKLGKETGAVLDDDAAKAAGDAATALDTMGITMLGLRNKIAIKFVPTLGKLAGKLTELVDKHGDKFIAWIGTMADKFIKDGVPAIEKFLDKLPGIIDKVGELAGKFANGVSAVADFLGGWENMAAVVLVANFAPTIVALTSLATSLWGVATAGLAAEASIGAVVITAVAFGLLLAGLVLVIWDLAEGLFGIGDGSSEVYEWLGKKLPDVIGGLENFFYEATLWAHDFGVKIGKSIGEFVEKVKTKFNELKEGWTKFCEGMGEMAFKAVAIIKETFLSFFNWIEGKWNAVGASIDGMWNKAKGLGDSIKGFFGGGSASPTSAPVAPPDQMAPRGGSTSMNNKVDINVNTNATNGKAFGQELRQELQRKPLFDYDGALVPA